MSAHNIHLQDKGRKSPSFIGISYLEEIPEDSRTCSTHPRFEPLKFYCIRPA